MSFTKSEVVNGVIFTSLSNVRKSGNEEGVYIADVKFIINGQEISGLYCARSDDYEPTGQWVYQSILEGNYDGEMIQLLPKQDPVTMEIAE